MSQAELTLGVDGMACEGCAKAVARAVNQLDPTAKVAVDLAAKRVLIREPRGERAHYEAAIRTAGYEILPLPPG